MGNKMTDEGMSVGLLCSVIGHTMGFKRGKWPENVWEETTEGKERHWNVIKGTKIGKAFAENQRINECFVEAGPQALTSQLWGIHWTLHWWSDPQVKEVWMRKEQVNDNCNWSETQVTLECPRRNANAGCRPKSHFYRFCFACRFLLCTPNCVVINSPYINNKMHLTARFDCWTTGYCVTRSVYQWTTSSKRQADPKQHL